MTQAPINGGIGGMGGRVRQIDEEHGIGRLERDGKMDCTYCWTVKRDVFDIPMLIVMNVSYSPLPPNKHCETRS